MGNKQERYIPWDFDCRSVSLDKMAGSAFVTPGRAAELYGVDGRLQGGLRFHPGFKKIRSLGLLTPTNAVATTGSIADYDWSAETLVLVKGGDGSYTATMAAGSLIEVTDGQNVMKGLYYVQSYSSLNDSVGLIRSINEDRGSFATTDPATGVDATRMTIAAFTSVTEFYDIRHFTLQIKGEVTVHGFVCRAKGIIGGNTRYQTWVEWYDPQAATWKSTVLEQSTTATAYGSLDPANLLSIAVSGRLLFVFRQGWEPILVTASATATAVTMDISYDTGPGEAPRLQRDGDSFTLGKWNQSTLHEIRPDNPESNWFTNRMAPDKLGINSGSSSLFSADDTGAWFTRPPSRFASMSLWARDVKDIMARNQGLIAGNYNFAYQLVDERTGRLSALSQIAGQNYARFGADTHNYFVWEIIYDSTKWTHARIYRTVNSDSAGGTLINSLLFLEEEIRLTEYNPQAADATGWDDTKATVYDKTATYTTSSYTPGSLSEPFKRAIFWMTQEDKSLVLSPLYNSEAFFDENMPSAGVSVVYDNTLIVSRAKDYGTGTSGVGEIRWSALNERSFELFPPDNRYVPKIGTDSPLLMLQLGDRVIGFGSNRQFMIYKSGGYIAIREMYDGYGVPGPWAAQVVGNEVFQVTTGGLVAVGVDGSMDAVRSLDYVFNVEWANQLSTVQVVFDAKTKCVYIVRPPDGTYEDHGEMCCLWQTTSMTSQLLHTRVVRSTQGVEPGSTDDASRAFFVDNLGTLFRVDDARAKTCVNSMLDTGAATIADCNCTVNTGTAPTYSSNEMTFTVSAGTLTSDMVGTVLSFTGNTTLGGRSFRITAINNTTKRVTVAVPSDLTGSLTNGEAVCINPMIMRVTAGPIQMQDEAGNSYGANNLFRRRRISTIRPHLLVTANYSTNPNAKVRGCAYRVNSETALVRMAPTENDGSEYTSVVDGPAVKAAKIQRAASLICPGIEIYGSGMELNLLGFRTEGTVESSDREDIGA